MSQSSEQPYNPFASPQTGPEEVSPFEGRPAPSLPEVRQGVTWLYAGLLSQLLVGFVMGGIGGAIGGMSTSRGEAPNFQLLQWMGIAVGLIPALFLITGVWKLLSAREEIQGRVLAQVALGFFVLAALTLVGSVAFVIGSMGTTIVNSISTVSGALGWLTVALFLKRVANFAGLERLSKSARNVAVLSGIVAALQPPMMIFSTQAAQQMINYPGVGAPPNTAWFVLMMLIGVFSIIWLIMNARLLHFMRKALRLGESQ